MRCVSVVVCLLFALSPRALAAPGAGSLAAASTPQALEQRDMEVIAGFARRFAGRSYDSHRCFAKDWGASTEKHSPRQIATRQLGLMTATAFVLAHQQKFDAVYPTLSQEIIETCGLNDPDPTPPLRKFLDRKFHPYLKSVHVLEGVGTERDYDMTLVALANLLYLFIDDKEILPDNIAYVILCQNGGGSPGCESEPEPWEDDHDQGWDGMGAYLTFGLRRDYRLARFLWHGFLPVSRQETENHVLSIYAWNYLASLFILNRGAQQDALPALVEWRSRGLEWLLGQDEQGRPNADLFFDVIMQALGRPLHSDFFETNSRPYHSISLRAILSLALYGSLARDLLPDEAPLPEFLSERVDRVRQAARNAMAYAGARFAFSSLRQKQLSPLRRKKEHAGFANFYSGNRASLLWGLLSGAHDYDDCTGDAPACKLLRYSHIEGQIALIWAALGRLDARWRQREGYELPLPVWGQFLDAGRDGAGLVLGRKPGRTARRPALAAGIAHR